MLLPIMIVMLGLFYVFFMLPQQRKVKAQKAMLANLDVGDEVLLTSGIYGRITEFDEGTMFVEIADGVEVKFTRDSVVEKILYEDDWEEPESDGSDEDADEEASETSGD